MTVDEQRVCTIITQCSGALLMSRVSMLEEWGIYLWWRRSGVVDQVERAKYTG